MDQLVSFALSFPTYERTPCILNLKNIFKGVDEAFKKLIENIFGKDIMEAFKKKRPAGFVDLMIAFESRKRGCSPNKLTPLNIALPFSFIGEFNESFVRKRAL